MSETNKDGYCWGSQIDDPRAFWLLDTGTLILESIHCLREDEEGIEGE
jgi:hypothetical protein